MVTRRYKILIINIPGTLLYMHKHILKESLYNRRVDVYSTGITLLNHDIIGGYKDLEQIIKTLPKDIQDMLNIMCFDTHMNLTTRKSDYENSTNTIEYIAHPFRNWIHYMKK
mgnify:CR=1 FL=1